MSNHHGLRCEVHMRIKIGEITPKFSVYIFNSNIDDPERDMSFIF